MGHDRTSRHGKDARLPGAGEIMNLARAPTHGLLCIEGERPHAGPGELDMAAGQS
jgi:hypothetical protein